MSATDGREVNPADIFSRIRAEVMTVVVGKEESFEQLLIAVLCRGHALVEDRDWTQSVAAQIRATVASEKSGIDEDRIEHEILIWTLGRLKRIDATVSQ